MVSYKMGFAEEKKLANAVYIAAITIHWEIPYTTEPQCFFKASHRYAVVQCTYHAYLAS